MRSRCCGAELLEVDERPAQIAHGEFLVDLFDLIEQAVERVTSVACGLIGSPVLRELARNPAPLRESLLRFAVAFTATMLSPTG